MGRWMSESTIDIFFYWVLCLHVAAAFWFLYRMITAEISGRRERRRPSADLECPSPAKLQEVPPAVYFPAVRGYDSPEVLRRDTLQRIRQIEKQIAANIRQMEEGSKT
jgi:hypothetical protein